MSYPCLLYTSIRYPEHFVSDKREVSLQGDAFFDVAKKQKQPFWIDTKEVKIEVLDVYKRQIGNRAGIIDNNALGATVDSVDNIIHAGSQIVNIFTVEGSDECRT